MLFYSVIQLILSKLLLKVVGAASFCFKALKHSTNKSINVKLLLEVGLPNGLQQLKERRHSTLIAFRGSKWAGSKQRKIN